MFSLRTSVIVIAVAIAIIAFIILVPKAGNNQTNLSELPPQPAGLRDLVFEDYQGQQVVLADLSGKPLVLNAWAAWCPFCKEELKDFAAVQDEFGDKVVIVTINRAEPLATAKKFSDELGVTNRLLLALDPTDSFYATIGGFAMPETLFIDSQGRVVFHKRGPMQLAEIRQRVAALLE